MDATPLKQAILGLIAATTVFAATFPSECAAATTVDTFTNAVNWGSFFAEPAKNIAVTNGRMDFTSTSTAGGGSGLLRNGPLLPLTLDWSVKVDVHVNSFNVAAEENGVSLFLGVGKTTDWFNTHVLLGFDCDWWYPGFFGVNDDVVSNGSSVPGLTNINYLPSPDATLRLDYSALNNTIAYFCDSDGAAGGGGWTSLGAINIAGGTYDLHLGPSDTLSVFLAGWSNGHVVTNGQAYFDNLEITISDPPSGFTYITNNGTITITGYTGAGGVVTIPDTIHGLSVKRIGNNAFTSNGVLTSVTIPNGITNIGENAFYRCTSLTNLDIGTGLTSIGFNVFAWCTNLPTVIIPNNVRNIGYGAFQLCTGLRTINIPNSVTNIEDAAFNGCWTLTNVSLGNSIVRVGSQAFYSCSSLTSVLIPSSTMSIGNSAFGVCTSLVSIDVDPNNAAFTSVTGVLFSKNLATLLACPTSRTGDYAVPTGTVSIGHSAFLGTRLTSVLIPMSVTSIGDFGFAWSSTVTRLFFTGNAPSLGGSSVFANPNNATVYYLAGKTGWGATYGGRPAVLWNPAMPASDPGFGVRSNRFGFTITGSANIPIVVEASTNVAGASWTPLLNGTLTNGSLYFSDAQWTNHPRRYYRIRTP